MGEDKVNKVRISFPFEILHNLFRASERQMDSRALLACIAIIYM